MFGDQETKSDMDSEEELMEMRATAEALEKQVAERLRVAKLASEKKVLEQRINELKRKLEMVEGEVDTQETEAGAKETADKEVHKSSSGATKFPDADGKLYYVIDKRDLPQRMEESQGFRRACDPRRHRELLLSEGTLINAEHVRQRLEARGGDNLLASSVDTIWESTALWDTVKLFHVFSGSTFGSFLRFKSHWKDYTICSLRHFVSGSLNEEDRSAIVLALDGLQTMFSYVYGSLWGLYLRFELEIVWSAFSTIMRHAYYDKDNVQVDISQPQSCVDILIKLYEAISTNTARELHFQNSLSGSIVRTPSRERVRVVQSPLVTNIDGSGGLGISGQGTQRKNNGMVISV